MMKERKMFSSQNLSTILMVKGCLLIIICINCMVTLTMGAVKCCTVERGTGTNCDKGQTLFGIFECGEYLAVAARADTFRKRLQEGDDGRAAPAFFVTVCCMEQCHKIWKPHFLINCT